jgi:hypothetical protein
LVGSALRRGVGAPVAIALAIAVAGTLLAPNAFADGPDAARAEALYNEALALADGGKYAEACPKYADSQRLDPALGTQFNLADCYEHVGQLANALSNFTAVERAARAAGKTNLSTRAHDRVARLDAKVPKLKITFAETVPDATVKIDGVRVADDTLPTVAVDPGAHVVEVTAPGKRPWTTKVATASGVTAVEIPGLGPVLAPPGGPPPTAAAARPAPPGPAPTWRIAGAALGGLGAIGLVIGGISGANALAKRNDAQSQCGDDDPKRCHSPEGVRTWDDAQSAGTISTIGFASGAVLLAAGAVLWFAAPSRPVVSGRVDPRGGAAAGIGGTF